MDFTSCNKNEFVINDLFYYLKKLREVNIQTIKCYSLNILYKQEEIEANLFELLKNIMILIPFKITKSDNSCKLKTNDGVMSIKFFEEISKHLFEKCLIDNADILRIIKKYRNKVEHKPHIVKVPSSSGGTGGNTYTLTKDIEKYDNIYSDVRNEYEKYRKENTIEMSEVVKLVININKLYIYIIKEAAQYIPENRKKYYHESTVYSYELFEDFNTILKAYNLKVIASILK